jgi:hypothetical protein
MPVLWTGIIPEQNARVKDGFPGPPPPLRGYGAASFAWLAEPKLTLRRKLA